MLVVCKYIVPSVTARVASEEECQGSSSPMSGAGRMLVTLTPRTVMPMAKDVLSTYLHIYRLGFSALDSPLPTLLMSHATGWLLVLSRMQMTLDRGVSSPCSHHTHAGTVTTAATKHQGTQLYLPQKLVSS